MVGYLEKSAWDLNGLDGLSYTRDEERIFPIFPLLPIFPFFSVFPFFLLPCIVPPVESYTRLTGLLRPTVLDWANQAYHTQDRD